jgi:hypothetical protein
MSTVLTTYMTAVPTTTQGRVTRPNMRRAAQRDQAQFANAPLANVNLARALMVGVREFMMHTNVAIPDSRAQEFTLLVRSFEMASGYRFSEALVAAFDAYVALYPADRFPHEWIHQPVSITSGGGFWNGLQQVMMSQPRCAAGDVFRAVLIKVGRGANFR